MRDSTKSRGAFGLLDSLEPASNALLFYDKERTLQKFLFHYVKAGLDRGEHVHYWAGTRGIGEVEKSMSDYEIDYEGYVRRGMLHFATYDEMLLVDGRLDLLNCHKNLYRMTENGRVRLATESNWWLLADLFEGCLDMEATHEMLPRNMSIVCTYDIADLLKYVSIYHLAKLMECHNNTLLINNDSIMLSHDFYAYLGRCILDALEDNFNYITIVRKRHPRFISDVLLELEMRIGSRMVELERDVEGKLMQKLNL
jgi:hypothetical protein